MSTLKKMFGKDRYIPRGEKERWDRIRNMGAISDYYETVDPKKDPQTYNYTGGEGGDYPNVSNDTDFIENRIKGAKGLVTLFGVPTAAAFASNALENGDKGAAQKAALIAGATAGAVGGIHGAGHLAKRYKYTKPRHIDEDQRQRSIDANIKNRADKLQKELDERWASSDDRSLEKTAGWLVNKEKKQRVRAMKFLGHQLERETRDAQSYKSKADALRPQEEVLWSQLERTRKLHDDDLHARFKAQELKEQLRPEEYVKDPRKKNLERFALSFDGPHYDNLRKAQREHDAVYGKRYDYDDDAKRHRQTATNLENDIKSQAKGYAEDFFGSNPTRKKALQRKERLIVGGGVAGAAATIGGLYAYNRYKKKKRAKAEQEKTAATKPSLGKKLYKSDSKLKDVAFGTYKKGPYQGDNKFNVAYGKRAVKKHYDKVFDKHTNLNPEDLYYDKAFDKRTQYGKENLRGIKNDYDDAFVEAAARPVALAAGTGAAIYGGKKLLDRYNKRQAEKKEKNYYV